MKHLLIYGSKQQNRQEILLEELSAYFDKSSRRLNAMIFAPTRRKVAELKNRILVHFERKCWMPEVVTFSQFMESHYGEVLGDRQLLSPYARLLVINHLLRGGQFGYLRKAQLSYGLSQKISDVLGHLQASLLVDEARNELIQQLTAESPEKAKTVELLDQTYHCFLEEHRLADENVLNFELLLKWQKDGYPIDIAPPLLKPPSCPPSGGKPGAGGIAKVLVLDEFAFFSELEKAVFHALVPSFQKIILTLAAPSEHPDSVGTGWRNYKTHRCYESIQSIVDWLDVYNWEERKTPNESEHLPEVVAERLFLNQPFTRISADVGKKDFRLIAAPNRREEVRTIARLIRQSLPAPVCRDDMFGGTTPEQQLRGDDAQWFNPRANSAGKPKIVADLRKFVVVCPDLTIYKSLVEEVFSEYRLPVKISRGYPLQQIPFIALLKKILTCVLTDRWTRSDLFDIFSSGWINFAPEISADEIAGLTNEDVPTDFSAEAFDIHRIDRLARAAGVQENFSINHWFGKIKLYLERDAQIPPASEFRIRNSEFGIENTEENDEQMAQAKERAQVAFDLLTMQWFIQCAQVLNNAQSAFEFKDALGQFIELVFFSRFSRCTNGEMDSPFAPLPNSEIRNPNSEFLVEAAYLQLISIVNEIVKTFRALGRGAGYGAQDYIEYITMAISSTELSEEYMQQFVEGENQNAVQVISPLETGGLSFENLFIAGLVEGEYPNRPIANFLISPDESQPLPIATLDPLPQERFFFQQMIGNSRKVVLTYPKMADGKELIPSPFVEDVRTLFEFPQGDKAYEIAPIDDSEKATLFSEQEVLKKMGELNNIAGSEHLKVPYANPQTQLKMEQAREQLNEFSIYDGHLHDKYAANIQQEYESPDFCYSVSQLDDYAQCPMKFFFKYILALEDLEEAESEIASDAKGRLVHKILERFGDIQRRENIDIEEAHAVMPRIVQDETRHYEWQFDDLYWEEEKRMLVSRLKKPDEPKGILKAFLEVEFEPEKELLNGNFKPTHFEYHFGSFHGEASPRSLATSATFALQIPRETGKPPIRIRGIIDRVDIDEEYQRFAVYDYKTGGYATVKKIERGISFQLPIYLRAVAQQENLHTPAAGAYYVLKKVKEVGKKGYLGIWDALKDEYKYKKDGSVKQPPAGFYSAEDYQRLEAFVIENIKTIDECIRSGKFNPSIWEEKDALCQWCKYKFICRYNASHQLNMKNQDGHYHPKGFKADR
jgi:superfamily I DNA/RNA helicase